jgi:hypothetical protein
MERFGCLRLVFVAAMLVGTMTGARADSLTVGYLSFSEDAQGPRRERLRFVERLTCRFQTTPSAFGSASPHPLITGQWTARVSPRVDEAVWRSLSYVVRMWTTRGFVIDPEASHRHSPGPVPSSLTNTRTCGSTGAFTGIFAPVGTGAVVGATEALSNIRIYVSASATLSSTVSSTVRSLVS